MPLMHRRAAALTAVAVTRSNVRLFHSGILDHETHVPTFGRQAQADTWVPRTDENRRRPQGALGAPREGPRPARALIGGKRLAAMTGASRRCRLTGAGAFEAVFRTGRRSEGEYLQLVSAPAGGACGRVGYVIGAKALPRAVDRNRLRRMLRVVLRDAKALISGVDVVVRIKRPAGRGEFARIVSEARRMLAVLPGGRAPP